MLGRVLRGPRSHPWGPEETLGALSTDTNTRPLGARASGGDRRPPREREAWGADARLGCL